MPTEEILKKYLNISRNELVEKCRVKDKRLVSKFVDLELEKKFSGEYLIIDIVKEAKKLPPVTENDWNILIKKNCPFFIISLQDTFDNLSRCLSPAEIPSADTVKRATDEYTEIYCFRVKES